MNTPNRDNNSSQNNSDGSSNTSFKWGSPASSGNVRFSPYQNTGNNGASFVNRSPNHRQSSPHHNNSYQKNNFPFRTPQPMPRYSSPHPRSWTGGDNRKQRFNNSMSPMKHYHNFKNARYDPNCNPGGSNDIEQYYQYNMIQDPWQRLTPCPISHPPNPTT
ncbi:hypothetical protein LOTGIDRAFT_238165 [Lottia gigantea]|uniref:M-phase-specific PLK1-interacting protein n=1 Tax=Lottia gigantea TaxID=225164 RepID=V4ACN6_LOTGI|nr:hypothetical protein LOTGIDRAFT_238165 [Lottia gigantea]ESP01779.1 hypothetical protein LOTGIDRAFT_238165 [Lottia gigantea]